ncbi:ribosomal-protein-alanine N-acetyltransferase [Planomicrobium soli]|uniref:Ribosomal-protein-alanine N-acetyltransferase n=1 Tax=Planomicrobium soli TaxID=1176648 RepID=A0A2P8H467_9BACL|nr:GNAT family protein [Planomicrobium soli]PSL41012.1 ribosomal-protein-alanine N-acetyltransferase [Planomicrobium soli]
MEYAFYPMTQEIAEEIAYQWHYDTEYSFYDMEADQEDLQEFVNPVIRGNSYFMVIQNNETIGFYCFHQITEKTIDMGLGMKPDLTGNGSGVEFLEAGMAFLKSRFLPEKVTLSVATFNKRAIKVYKKIGFEENGTFIQATNGGNYEFLKMIYHC